MCGYPFQDVFDLLLEPFGMNLCFECFRHFLNNRLVVFLNEAVKDRFFLAVVPVFDFNVGLASVATQVNRLVGGV